MVAGLIVLCLASATAQPANAPSQAAGESLLYTLAPQLARVVQLAALDPLLAASLVPDPWIDSMLSGAIALEGEEAAPATRADPPRRWPVGPWSDPESLRRTVETVDPGAVASLYRALTPRVAGRCRVQGRSLATCERALRASGVRLSDRSVLARASGDAPGPLTPTQRELARLGAPVVVALRTRIGQVGNALWGASWQDLP